MPSKKCPVCGVSVKLENLERHVKDQHPKAKVETARLLTATEKQEAKHAQSAPRPKMSTGGKRIVAGVAIVLAIVLVIIIVNPFRGVGPSVGSTAPDFTISACPSGTMTLSSHRGSPVLLELMDADCPACQAEAPVFASLYATYSPRGVVFLSVSLIDFVSEGGPDTCATLASFEQTYANGTTWPYGLDTTRSVRSLYNPSGTPTTFIIDRAGVISYIFLGRARNGASDYAAQLNRVLA